MDGETFAGRHLLPAPAQEKLKLFKLFQHPGGCLPWPHSNGKSDGNGAADSRHCSRHHPMAMPTGPGPLLKTRELRSSRLHHRLPWPCTSWFSHGAGTEALPYCGSLPTSTLEPILPPSTPHSRATPVSVVPTQLLWLHKQLQGPHNVCSSLQGQGGGQGMRGLATAQPHSLQRHWPRDRAHKAAPKS